MCKNQEAWEEKPKTRSLHLQTEKKKLPWEETDPRSQEWRSGCLHFYTKISSEGFPGGSAGKESACNAGNLGSIPWLWRSPGEGNSGYRLQYSGLENSVDYIYSMRVTKSRTQLSKFHFTSGKICIEGCLLDVATMKLLMTLARTLFKINFYWNIVVLRASQVAQLVKNPPASAGDVRDAGLIPGSERSPGVENGSPLPYSYLESSLNRGAWCATVHGGHRELDTTKGLSK